MIPDAARTSLVEWSVASRPRPGETVSGDLHLVEPFERGVLLGVIDGVGHGPEAALAAQVAAAVLEARASDGILSLVRQCHRAVSHTRGVVMTVASLRESDRTVTWLGVGNVEGRLWRADVAGGRRFESVLLRPGVVGYQLPPLQACVLPLAPGDTLVLATDGVHPGFGEGINPGDSPQYIADRTLARHLKGNDDAMVLVARYVGRAHA